MGKDRTDYSKNLQNDADNAMDWTFGKQEIFQENENL